MTPVAIEIQDLTKDYAAGFWRKRSRRALDALTLEVQEGEVFGFLGPNGAGKTTTVKLLAGLTFPTSGSARILGRRVGDVEVRRYVGYLPEQPYFYEYLTARELLDYFARMHGLAADDRHRHIAQVLEITRMSSAGGVQLRKFSKGMLQRVGIAQALLHDPQVILLDEPMSGLDPVGRREVRDIILDLKRRGRTVFFSTHILPDAEMLCDRVAVLVGGKLQGVGAVSEIAGVESQCMEVLFELPAGGVLARLLEGRARPSGSRWQVNVAEAELYEVFAGLRASGARIVSVAQVKPELEDFFFKMLGKEASAVAAAAPVELVEK